MTTYGFEEDRSKVKVLSAVEIDSKLANGAKAFANVAAMKAASNLKQGDICHTDGFHASCDGGAAFYEIVETATANEMDVIACGDLFATLVNSNSKINIDKLGAYGNGSTDDSSVFNYAVANYDYIELSEKTYKIAFSKVNLTGKTLVGCGAKSQLPGGTIIEASNANVPFCVVGKYTTLQDFSIKSYNNNVATPILLFGHDGTSFVRNDYHVVKNLDIACDGYSRAIMFNLVGTDSDPVGGIGGLIDNINVFGSDKGVYIFSDSSYSWLTETTISNILVYAPKTSGFELDVTAPAQVSQMVVSDFTVDLRYTDSVGFKMDATCPIIYNNLITFVDGAPGSSNHKAIDFGTKRYRADWQTPYINYAMLEGKIENIEYGYDYITNGLQVTNDLGGGFYAPTVYDLESPSILLGGNFTSLYDVSPYSSNVSIDSGLTLAKSKNDYFEDVMTLNNASAYSRLMTYDFPTTLPADLNYNGYITYYMVFDAAGPNGITVYFGNGVSTHESKSTAKSIATLEHPNRYLAKSEIKLSDYVTGATKFAFGFRVPAKIQNLKVVKVDARIGFLNLGKILKR